MAFPQDNPPDGDETPKQAISEPNSDGVALTPRDGVKSSQIGSKRLTDDPNYQRLMGPNGEEIGLLGYECGHHCLVHMAGKHQLVHHCSCPNCHDGKEVVYGSPS